MFLTIFFGPSCIFCTCISAIISTVWGFVRTGRFIFVFVICMKYIVLDNFKIYQLIEWLLSNVIWAIVQLCHGENKLLFDELMINEWLLSWQEQVTFRWDVEEWVSDCSLMPSEQVFSYILARTSYFFQWENDEWVSEWLLLNTMRTIFQLYHGENKLRVSEWLLLNTKRTIFQLYHGENKLRVSEWLLLNTKRTNFQFYHGENKLRVSEWLLFIAKWTKIQLYHSKKKLLFDEMMSILY